jgi:hypothetical protein
MFGKTYAPDMIFQNASTIKGFLGKMDACLCYGHSMYIVKVNIYSIKLMAFIKL